jgi:hypothetical protein
MRVSPVHMSFLKETRKALSYRHCSFHIINGPQPGCGLKYFMRLVAIGIAYGGEKHALQERFGQQFGHVFWVRVAKVGDLMPAACA